MSRYYQYGGAIQYNARKDAGQREEIRTAIRSQSTPYVGPDDERVTELFEIIDHNQTNVENLSAKLDTLNKHEKEVLRLATIALNGAVDTLNDAVNKREFHIVYEGGDHWNTAVRWLHKGGRNRNNRRRNSPRNSRNNRNSRNSRNSRHNKSSRRNTKGLYGGAKDRMNAASVARRKGDIRAAIPRGKEGISDSVYNHLYNLINTTPDTDQRDKALAILNRNINAAYEVFYDPGQDHYNKGAHDLTHDDPPGADTDEGEAEFQGGSPANYYSYRNFR